LLKARHWDECLRAEVLRTENGLKTVNALRAECAARNERPEESQGALPGPQKPIFKVSRIFFFQPYKRNHISFGVMDNADGSTPFVEYKYNPEIFWDFTESLARPASRPRWHIEDLVGLEYQYNGLDGMDSRSRDRIYAQREFRLSEGWSWIFTYWHIVNLGDFNEDIEDYGSFILSYHNSFNEALISHDTKTSSLHAGFYFPLGF
jgi:hypothetical protein